MAERYTGRTLRELIRVVASRFIGMAIVIIVVVGAAAVATQFAPRTYRSQVRLMATPSRVISPLESSVGARDEVALFIVTQREIALSDHVLASAMMRLETGRKTFTENQVAQWIAESPARLQRMISSVDVITPGGTGAAFTQTFAIRVDWSEDPRADRKPNTDSRALAAKRAQQLATYVKDAYKGRYQQLESKRTKAAADFLSRTSLAAARANLDKATEALEAYIKTELRADLPLVIQMYSRGAGAEMGIARLRTTSREEINALTATIAELQATRRVLGKEIVRGQIQVDKLKAGQTPDFSKVVIPDVVLNANDPIKRLQGKITTLMLTLVELRTRYTQEYQTLRNARTELNENYVELVSELTRHEGRLAQEVERLEARQAALQTIADKDRADLDQLSSKVASYDRLRKDVDTATELHNKEQERVIAAVTANELSKTPILVSVLDNATQPDPASPYRPIAWLNILIAALAAVTLAMIYAFMADHFDHTIKSVDDAERYLGVPVLASVPKLGRRIIRTA